MKLKTLQPTVPLLSTSKPQRELPVPRSPAAQERKRFYDSALWQSTRAAKLRRDPLCQCCAGKDIIRPAEHVDHWVPLAQGGQPTADDNLVSLCQPCHSSKTRSEQVDGPMPLIVRSAARRPVIA